MRYRIFKFIKYFFRLASEEVLIFCKVTFKTLFDWNGRMLDSCGKCGRAETHARSVCDEEAQDSPHWKRAFWSGNQLSCHILKLQQYIRKTALFLTRLTFFVKI